MHQDDNDTQKRQTHRRAEDIKATAEFSDLRHEFYALSTRITNDEKRLELLERDNDELQRKLSIGKGLLYGVLIASGGLGLFVVDSLKQFIGLAK